MVSVKVLSLLLQKSEASPRFITRWPRAVARLADLIWQLIVVAPVVYLILQALEIQLESTLLSAFLFFLITLPLALLLDALIGGLLGNTPAKVLVGLRVRNSSGGKLNLGQFIKRNYGVWTQGLFLGVIPLTVIAGMRQFKQITGRRPTTYDEVMHTQVFSLPSSGRRAMLVTLVIFLSPLALLFSTLFSVSSKEDSMVSTSAIEVDKVNAAVLQSGATTDAVAAETKVAESVISTASTASTGISEEARTEANAEAATAIPATSTTTAGSANKKVLVANLNTESAVRQVTGNAAEVTWTNPVSGYAISISHEFSVLNGQSDEQRLATFNHRSGNSSVNFEQHSAADIENGTEDGTGLQQFLQSTYSNIEVSGDWVSYEFGEQTIFTVQGKQFGDGNNVSIQATTAAGKIYVLLIHGNWLETDVAKHNQLAAAVWNSI